MAYSGHTTPSLTQQEVSISIVETLVSHWLVAGVYVDCHAIASLDITCTTNGSQSLDKGEGLARDELCTDISIHSTSIKSVSCSGMSKGFHLI